MPELGKSDYETDPLYFFIPMRRYILMSFFTFGIYQFYWIYKNWEYLKNRDNMQIHPFWRGWFGIFFCDSLLKEIHDDIRLNQSKPPEFCSRILATGWILLIIGGYLFSRFGDKIISDSFVILVILLLLLVIQIWFFMPVQHHINNANERIKPAARYYPWSAGHYILLGIAFIILVFSLTQSS